MTNPIAGWVKDGDNQGKDLDFASEAASIYANWNGFYDPESGIEKYTASVYVNDELSETFALDGTVTNLEDHTLHFQHGDHVHVSFRITYPIISCGLIHLYLSHSCY